MLTCDGNMTVYVDGKQVNNKTSNYTIAQETTIPPKSSILLIHCNKPNKRPVILGCIDNSTVTSNKNWMCTNAHSSPSNATPLTETLWAPAFAHGYNKEIPYGSVHGISDEAKWIGTSKVINGTDSLYCRLTLCPIKGNTSCDILFNPVNSTDLELRLIECTWTILEACKKFSTFLREDSKRLSKDLPQNYVILLLYVFLF